MSNGIYMLIMRKVWHEHTSNDFVAAAAALATVQYHCAWLDCTEWMNKQTHAFALKKK